MAEHLDAGIDGYRHAATLNIAPPAAVSDPLVDGATPVEELLRVLGLAANSGDPADNADSADLHAQRDAWTTEAAGTFSGQDTAAAGQIISGVAGSLTGALSGVLQPLAQLPQQLAQGAQQAVRATTSLAGQNSSSDPLPVEDRGLGSGDESVPEPIDFGDPGEPQPPAVMPTIPAAVLGPAPSASSATHPSASSATPPVRVGTAPPARTQPAAMTGMPMVPPTALPAAGGDGKPDTRRLAVSSPRNGAPVQGRVTPAWAAPTVTTRIDGKPVAARTSRIAGTAEE